MDIKDIRRLAERIKFPGAVGIWYFRNKEGISDSDVFSMFIEEIFDDHKMKGTITDRYGKASFEGTLTSTIISFKKRYETKRHHFFDYSGDLIEDFLYQGQFNYIPQTLNTKDEQGFILRVGPDLVKRL